MQYLCKKCLEKAINTFGRTAVAKAMVHGELMQKEGLEGTMDMYMNLSENVRNRADSREVAREMMKAHLKKVRGMTVQDKEMEKTRQLQAAKKKLKSDGILRAVMGNAGSGDWESGLVTKKPKKPRARKAWSSAEESSDDKPIKPRKKKKSKKDKSEGKFIKGQKVVDGNPKCGLNGLVQVVRPGGLSTELKKEAPTNLGGKCNFCGTKGHKTLECDRKVDVDGETVYPMGYLFKKGLVDSWGVITAKGKEKKSL